MANGLDIDFKDRSGKWVLRFKDKAGKFWQTRLGRLHNNMTQRARQGGSFQGIHRTYVGVTLDDEFNCPQKFCNWAVKQRGWGKDWHLDKDLIDPAARRYGPDTCVFLPPEINNAIKHKNASGVVTRKKDFKARFGKNDTVIGIFDTEQEANAHYREFKELYVQMLADTYKDDLDPRAYQALQNWTVH